MPIRSIVLIGAGRVATQLGKALHKQNKTISQVYSRTMENATQLGFKLNAKPVNEISGIDSNADLYIIAVADDAIAEIATKVNFPGKIVVHTSGSVAMEALSPISEKSGVFYPLNTFSKSGVIDFSSTPICIEASDNITGQELTDLGKLLSNDVRYINSRQRAVIHLAAVFACNFTNFMMVNAEEILKTANVDFDILLPLISETISKLSLISPKDAQTGPALRNDVTVLQKHLDMLGDDQGKKMIYELISRQINDFYNSK